MAYSKYRDHVTAELGLLAGTRDSIHKTYIATVLRSKEMNKGNPAYGEIMEQWATGGLLKIQVEVDRELVKTLKRHVLWDWLEPHRGVRGAHVARLISMLGDPHRFPGRVCEDGHHLPCDWVGDCGRLCGEKGEKPHLCGATVGMVRRGTGTRSVWHYFGQHADDDGNAPRMRKGQRCSWTPMGRACLLQKDGIADQIVRHRVEPWRTKYDSTKRRVSFERGAEISNEDELSAGVVLEGAGGAVDRVGESDRRGGELCPISLESEAVVESESEAPGGHTLEEKGSVVSSTEIEDTRGVAESGGAAEIGVESADRSGELRPIEIEGIAKKVAVKAFLADLLMAWKERAPCRNGE